MAAKQKHIQRVKQRIVEKLRSLDEQEEAHYAILHEHISKVKQQAKDLLQLDDSSQFLSHYSRVIQGLDACYNNLELLTADAEDRLNNSDVVFTDTLGLDTRSVTDDLCSSLHSPSSVAGYDSLTYKDLNADRTLTHCEERSSFSPLLFTDERPKAVYNTSTPQAKVVRPQIVAVGDGLEEARNKSSGGSSPSRDDPKVDDVFKTSTETVCTIKTKEPENISKQENVPVQIACSNENRQSTAIPKQFSVPEEVKRQLKQKLEPIVESDSSLNTSQSHIESVEDSSNFEEKVHTTSSPKKKSKSKKSKKKGHSQKTQSTSRNTDLSSLKHENTKSVVDDTDSGFASQKEIVTSQTETVVKEKQTKTDEVTVTDKKVNQTEKVKEVENVAVKIQEKVSGKEFSVSSEPGETRTSKTHLRATNTKHNIAAKDTKRRNYLGLQVVDTVADISEQQKVISAQVEETNEKGDSATSDKRDKFPSASVSVSEGANVDSKENFQLDDKIRISQGTLLEREATPVIVSEIINPWCFYVQRCCTSLNGLMEEICTYMSTVGLNEKSLENPEEQKICLAWYSKDNLYYRALISKVHTAEVDVIYIDYGNRERVKLNKLRVLPEHLTLLPAQAICCALAEVMPCNKYMEWREEDIFTFSQYVLQKQLECVLVGRSSGKNMPNLVRLFLHTPMPAVAQQSLYVTKICIGTVLVSGGLAKEVSVPEQVRMIMKFMEDMWDVVFTLGSSSNSGVEIKELMESPVGGSAKAKKPEPQTKNAVSLDLEKDSQNLNKQEPVVSVGESQTKALVSSDLKKDSNVGKVEPMISDSESQTKMSIPLDEKKDSENSDEADPAVSESVDTMSNITEPDTSDARSVDTGFHSSDFNFNLDLNPQGHAVMLAHVKSPSLFYVHVVSRQVGHTLDRLMRCLNQQFEKISKKQLARLSKSLVPAVNKICCARFLADNCFYRAIIKELPPEQDTAEKKTKDKIHVFYIDFGDDEWLPLSRLFPLPEPFIYLPPLVLKCSLAYVKPVSNGKDGNATWSDKAVDTFVSMVTFEKQLLMHVVHGTLSADQKGELVGEDNSTLGVLLVDNSSEEEVCINMDLIGRGLAELDTANAPVERKEVSEAMTGWNPMEEDYFSVRNSYKIDVDDPGVATTGYNECDWLKSIAMEQTLTLSPSSKPSFDQLADSVKRRKRIRKLEEEVKNLRDDLRSLKKKWRKLEDSTQKKEEHNPVETKKPIIKQPVQNETKVHVPVKDEKAQDEKRVCKYYSKGLSCWRGDRCPWRHVRSSSGVTMDQEELFFIYNNQESLLPEVHCWVAMEVSTILTPGHFYAILPMGNKSLDGADSTKETPEVYGELKDTETLDDLQAALNEEYGNKSRHEGTLTLRAPGEIVAAKFQQDHQWYRARVLQSTEEQVKVFYLDFGNTEWISARDTHEIEPQYLHLPFQAIECFLHNMEPVGGSDTWSKESKSGFRQLVDGKTLVGHVKSKYWNGCIWIELYDTTGKEDINIADAMVEKGFAVRSKTFTETSSGASVKSDAKSEVLLIPG